MKRLSSRFHLAFGLVSLLLSIVLLGIYLGLVPDRDQALRAGRISLAETIAIGCSALLERDDVAALRTMLGLVLQRNPEILSAGVRTARGELVVDMRGHAARWRPAEAESSSVEGQLQVPLWHDQRRWGTVELRFAPIGAEGFRGFLLDPRVKLTLFLLFAAFGAFYFYLKRMLRHLDPSRAVPARVRAALDTLAEGLLVLDAKGYIVLANRAFADVVGETPEELIGRAASRLPWTLANGESCAPEAMPWRQAAREGAAQRNRTVYLVNAAGARRTFRVNCTPVLGAGVRDTPVLVSLDDVTDIEEKELELVAARSKAEAASRSKSDFLANMSHEIRTPMNAILGFTELLRRGSARKGEDLRKHLDTIHSSGRHLLALINDILDLSKIEAGHLEVERIECAPLDLLREVARVLAVKAQEKGIVLRLEYGGPIPARIVSDPARLRQIVTNLVGNAIKFTQQGVVRVTPRLRADGAQARLVIEVADSGIGIPADKLETIFEPFTQAETSTTRRFGGTGLGLTISRRLARALGGDITVASVPGEGSVFTVALDPGPIEDAVMLDRAAFETTSPVEASAAASTRWVFPPARVLVVDDGAENRQLVRLVLEECGLEIEEADNGQAALERIAASRFAAVLMDVQMPVMDGFAATRALRLRGDTLPVIALTANAMKGFEREIEEAGFSGYLTKPIDIELLLAELAQRLGGERRAADPAPAPQAPVPAANDAPIVSRLAHHPKLRKVAVRFAAELPHKLDAMEAAWAKQDLEALAALAHWLKGSGGTVGYDDFFEPARQLEEMARTADIPGIAEKLPALRALAARVVVPEQSDAQRTAAVSALPEARTGSVTRTAQS